MVYLESKLEKIQRIVDNWRRRNLTIIGRVLITKTLLLSQIIHLIMFCPVPNSIIKRLNKIIYNFVWNSKIDKVKRNIISRNFADGGIKMIDIQNLIYSFRLKWLSRILDESDCYWKDFANIYFEQLGGLKLLLNCTIGQNMIEKHFVGKLPSFYLEILKAWSQIKEKCNQYDLHSDQQILWYNKYVTYNNNPLFYKEWYLSNIIYLKDICDNGTFISTTTLKDTIEQNNAKANAIFDYFKLRISIPKVWINNLKRGNVLSIPVITICKKERELKTLSSKVFYQILTKNEIAHKCPPYWENIIEINMDWNQVFKRNLKDIKENRLKQFNFKMLYNLISTKRMLFV